MKLFILILSIFVFTQASHAQEDKVPDVTVSEHIQQDRWVSGVGWAQKVSVSQNSFTMVDSKLGLIVLNNGDTNSLCTFTYTDDGKYQLTSYNGYAGKKKQPLCWKKMMLDNSDYVIILMMANGAYHVYAKERFAIPNLP